MVLAVGFSWWLSAWVSLSDSCGGCFFVAFLFCFLWLFFFFFFFFFFCFLFFFFLTFVVVGSGFGGFF